MGKFEGRIGLIPCSVFFYCLGFQIGVICPPVYHYKGSSPLHRPFNKFLYELFLYGASKLPEVKLKMFKNVHFY